MISLRSFALFLILALVFPAIIDVASAGEIASIIGRSSTFTSLTATNFQPEKCSLILVREANFIPEFRIERSKNLASQWQQLIEHPTSSLLWLEQNSEAFQAALGEVGRALGLPQTRDLQLKDLLEQLSHKPKLSSKEENFLQDFTNRLRYIFYQVDFVRQAGPEDSALLARLILDRLGSLYFWNYNQFTFSDPSSRAQWKKLKFPLYASQFHFQAMLETALGRNYSRRQKQTSTAANSAASNTQARKLADQIHDLGWNYLIHATPIENLVGILKDNRLRKIDKNKNTSADDIDETSYGTRSFDKVFFEAIGYARSGETIQHYRLNEQAVVKKKITSLVLVFDLDLFNLKKYIFSNAWLYGEFVTGLSGFSESPDLVLDVLADSASGRLADRADDSNPHNELAISQNVDLSLLREIWVDPSSREVVLQQLRLAKIKTIHGRPIEDFVKAKVNMD